MEPENDGFQEELPFLGTSFQVPCYISGELVFLEPNWISQIIPSEDAAFRIFEKDTFQKG